MKVNNTRTGEDLLDSRDHQTKTPPYKGSGYGSTKNKKSEAVVNDNDESFDFEAIDDNDKRPNLKEDGSPSSPIDSNNSPDGTNERKNRKSDIKPLVTKGMPSKDNDRLDDN